MKRQALLVAVTIILIVLAVWQRPVYREEAKIGKKAPAIRLAALDGKSYTMRPANGKVLLIHYWASWCEPCRNEAPELNDYYVRHRDRIEIMAVNLTVKDHIADIKEFVRRYNLSFPILLDSRSKAAEAYHVAVIPTSYWMDANGVILGRKLGAFDRESLETQLSPLLAR